MKFNVVPRNYKFAIVEWRGNPSLDVVFPDNDGRVYDENRYRLSGLSQNVTAGWIVHDTAEVMVIASTIVEPVWNGPSANSVGSSDDKPPLEYGGICVIPHAMVVSKFFNDEIWPGFKGPASRGYHSYKGSTTGKAVPEAPPLPEQKISPAMGKSIPTPRAASPSCASGPDIEARNSQYVKSASETARSVEALEAEIRGWKSSYDTLMERLKGTDNVAELRQREIVRLRQALVDHGIPTSV